jgi:hypothetical protein
MYLFEDKQGKPCAAKSAFTLTMATCLGKILLASYTGESIDYNGMAVLIGSVGAIYYGRSRTKEVEK